MTGGVVPGILACLALAGLALAALSAVTARWVRRRVPPQGRLLDVDGARLHVVDRGSGRALVLIHGLNGTGRNFTHSVLERLKDEFRVVVLDRPGAGHSVRSRHASPGPLGDADAVASLIRTLDLDRPVLVGHSLGGAVALATAVQHPELVSGLALVSPLTHPQAAPPAVFRALRIGSRPLRLLLAWTLAPPVTLAARAAAVRIIFAPEPVAPDFGVRGGGLLAVQPRQFFGASSDLMAVPDAMTRLLPAYGSLQVPVAILYGRGDRILDPELHGLGMRSRVPGARIELVPGGHMLPVTQPDAVAALVREVARRAWVPSRSGVRS